MRFSKFILPVVLSLAVVASLVLSVILWINPANYRNDQNSTRNTQNSEMIKPRSAIYSPTQAVENNRDGSQDLLVNRSVNMIGEIKDSIENYKPTGYKTISKNSQDEYFKIAKRPNSVMLNYSSSVNLKTVGRLFKHKLNNSANPIVNRVILPLNDTSRLYLLGDRGFKVYEVKLEKHNLEKLNNVLNLKLRRFPVAIRLNNDVPMMYLESSVDMQPYKYLVNRQTEDYYVSRLLNDQDSTNVSVKKRRGTTTYSDQNSQQLDFNSRTRAGEFIDYQIKNQPRTLYSSLTKSYKTIRDLGVSMDNVKFYGYDVKNREISFRTFVEGFPIFKNNGFGAVSIRNRNAGVQRTKFLLDTPQVPLPSKSGMTTLPSTDTVISRLTGHGYNRQKIGKIRLGYTWNQKKPSSMLITLTPDWYVLYNGKWSSYTELMQQNNQ
ncbi:two-component system activity regulator YycH [Lentilactobacillus sp. Marseille-Q4993]|uniref:YycH family regulatory protein n=1 Tax=Lentilactobacillus sp. Marseille-Q4993 TaxID=3039492 RepID=UPI0024BD3B7B|nr:two-component system activity regulator YycH [Lentilactobacillus sp. Marseille-Q4993]